MTQTRLKDSSVNFKEKCLPQDKWMSCWRNSWRWLEDQMVVTMENMMMAPNKCS
jgi:hypothetical protein